MAELTWQMSATGVTRGSEIAIHKKINDVAELLRASEGVQVRSESALAEFLANLRQTQGMFAAVSIVTLLVAVIGLLNLGLATLRERVRELSLRRAVGATALECPAFPGARSAPGHPSHAAGQNVHHHHPAWPLRRSPQ